MVGFDTDCIRQHLDNAEFNHLFNELGWDQPPANETITVNDKSIPLEAVAEKRGLVVYRHDSIPDSNLRRKIDNALTKLRREHLIIFAAEDNSRQEWQWVKREHGKGARLRTSSFHQGQSNESLIQKLRGLYFSFEEEDTLTLPDTVSRVRANFDVEKVTKRFYDEFTKRHQAFLNFIEGIPDEEFRRWYASVMLNRLMFIYFLQKKGFLNNDLNYLYTKLQQVKEDGGDYYRRFLCPLFFEGFAKQAPDRSPEARELLGNIPYLNGGLFNKHEVEEKYGADINISDSAFKDLFNFFDQYQWHLDERPLKKDNEINPDVLGYIFEKYINQKQMGAYYTKEDITGYIARNTILPWLFEFARKKCKVAFEPDSYLWRLLKDDPDRYIYEAVRHGVDRKLPKEIAAGIKDISKRTNWNKKAPKEYALPTEIWREVVARRQRYEGIKEKIASGQIQNIEDFITYNLDIERFALDAVQYAEGPEFVRAFWQGLKSISVLDPACGSGAFLFAALNILEGLYEACLDHMQAFVDDLDRSDDRQKNIKLKDFREILERTQEHPNRAYFIYKTIIVLNLYGVDIMDEAIEICKLRLFLKLAAQLESPEKIEPLPDIDFNIKAGNSLVGYTSFEDVEKTVKGKFQFDDTLKKLRESAQDLDKAFDLFRQQQTELGGEITAGHKTDLRNRLIKLEEELNLYLAKDYGIDLDQKSDKQAQKAYEQWQHSHRPFHWLIEFYGIIDRSGFDVIIGNPPYVVYTKNKIQYLIQNLRTLSCANLYAFFCEKSYDILSKNSFFGMIIPNSSISADKMNPLQKLFIEKNKSWISNYSWRPAKLFEGAEMRLSVVLTTPSNNSQTYSSCYYKWHSQYRPNLLKNINYNDVSTLLLPGSIPKIPNKLYYSIFNKIKMISKNRTIATYFSKIHTSHWLYYFRAVQYWIKILEKEPVYKDNGVQTSTGEMKKVFLQNKEAKYLFISLLSSNLYFIYYIVWASCQVMNSRDFNFPFDINQLSPALKSILVKFGEELQKNYQSNSKIAKRNYSKRGRKFVMEKQHFYIKKSKPIIDEIDKVLAKHYGFTDEELDFIINYDIKYRMGADE